MELPTLDSRDTIWMAEPSRMLGRTLRETEGGGQRPAMRQRIAVINLSGVIVKGEPLWSDEVSSTETAVIVRHMAESDTIAGILLVVDSPGGMASGTEDLAEAVHAARERKPVHAFVDGMAASAAYWVASQATKVYAGSKTALVGSIGTYLGLYDFSGAMEQVGIKPVLITSGGVKGQAAFVGAKITDDAKASFQRIVDGVQQEFSAGVARGRGMPPTTVAKLADGRVHLADEAQRLGLVDGIKSFDEVLAELGVEAERVAAPTLDQRLSAIEQKVATIGPKIRAAAAKKRRKPKAPVGVRPLGQGRRGATIAASDAIVWWNEEIRAQMDLGMSRAQAARIVARECPGLREAFVAASNARRR